MSQNTPFVGSEQWQRCCQLYADCVERFHKLLNTAMDVLEEHLKDKYGPVCHRAANTMLRASGIGRAFGKSLLPVSSKPRQSPSGDEMTPATMKALVQAVKTIDLMTSRGAPLPAK
jgi:hypothetical protein